MQMDKSRKESIQGEAKRPKMIVGAKDQSSSRVIGFGYQLRSIKGGESKQKGPPLTGRFHVHQFNRIPRDRLEFTPNIPRRPRSLFTYVPTSQQRNIVEVAETEKIQEEPYVVVTSVPDPDFYNFDKDRMVASFGENQVWSVYDEYGMPRLYALVRMVVTRKPFELCISWLNSNRNDELGPMKWIESGYNKTSGNFSIGKRNNYESLNSFSHIVQWEKGAKGLVHIYPKKGNVWALYSNWSPSWDISTSLKVMEKYDMVEVLKDFDEEEGVAVAPLVKLPGFLTVFGRVSTPRTYPKKELFRFSHQVPYRLLTGKEGKNAPKGCLELDPAALSQDLLKIFSEEQMRETGECSQ